MELHAVPWNNMNFKQSWAFFVKRGLNRVFSALTVTIETFNQKWRFPFSVTVSVASNTLQIKATYDLSRDRRLFHLACMPCKLDNRLLELGSETGMKTKFIMPCVAESMPSLVWQFYEKAEDPNYALCNFCKAKVSCKSGTTGGLRNHKPLYRHRKAKKRIPETVPSFWLVDLN